jgi:hypothetical protein
MPHASRVILKVRLPFVALVALSRETRGAAGASSSVHLPKVAAKVGSGRPPSAVRRPAHGCVSSYQRKYAALSKRSQSSIEVPKPLAGFMSVGRRGLASSLSINLQVQLKRRSCGLCLQRWYASPSKSKARLQLTERGLTLPSSGPAYGSPLKSNVRRRHFTQEIR